MTLSLFFVFFPQACTNELSNVFATSTPAESMYTALSHMKDFHTSRSGLHVSEEIFQVKRWQKILRHSDFLKPMV